MTPKKSDKKSEILSKWLERAEGRYGMTFSPNGRKLSRALAKATIKAIMLTIVEDSSNPSTWGYNEAIDLMQEKAKRWLEEK